MTTDRISDELYEALRSMTESYDIAIANMPRGVARDSLAGYFIGVSKPANEALEKYTKVRVLKARNSNIEAHIKLFGDLNIV